ncbi:MAG: hypothetical protein KDD35_00390 [Bdellovibrionales bacterium]|nr:hypothetical protein [Bdellovibrionales bacterium]
MTQDPELGHQGFARILLMSQLCLLIALLSSCSTKNGSHWYGALGLGSDRIYLSGSYANSNNYAISVYDTTGKLLGILADYGANVEFPRGLAFLDPFRLIVSVDGTDRLDVVDIFGNISTFASNALLSGNLFDVRRDSSGNIYVAESNTIERFNSSGARYPVTGNPYINTTTGSCVLSTVHGLAITSQGYLAAVSSGGSDNLSIYDVSDTSASCLYNVAFGQDPYDVVAHSNGKLYVVTQLNDSIYTVNEDGTGATQIYAYGVTTINPTAIAVLPNGNLLVANAGLDSIDLFAEDGTLLQSGFIRNTFSADVSDILVVEGQ